MTASKPIVDLPPRGLEHLDLPFDSVVVISPYYWMFRDDMWQTTHQMTQQFSRLLPTVYIEPAVQWNPRTEGFRFHRLWQSVGGARTRQPRKNLTVFHRRGVPFGSVEVVRNFDLGRNANALKTIIRRMGFRKTLLWHSFPYWSERIMEGIDYSTLAYHCLDYTPREEESRIVRRSDTTFCVSETLVEKYRVLNPRTYHLPNGVDFDQFNRASALGRPRPADLPAGRVIGFVGSLNAHIDFDLLIEVARAFPSDTIALIGPIILKGTALTPAQLSAFEKLRSMANVRALGFRPVEDLPGYMANFDACLIPFLVNEFNRERDPLKFYQYLAMGKPIVSSPVPVAQRYPHACYLSRTREEFVANISAALNETNPQQRAESRLALAREHSWEALTKKAIGLLSTSRSAHSAAEGPEE